MVLLLSAIVGPGPPAMADENLNGQVVLPLHVATGKERVTIVLWDAKHRLVDDAEVRILVSYPTQKMGQLMPMNGMGIALPPIIAKPIGLGFYQANAHFYAGNAVVIIHARKGESTWQWQRTVHVK